MKFETNPRYPGRIISIYDKMRTEVLGIAGTYTNLMAAPA